MRRRRAPNWVRSRQSAHKYASIWTDQGSPLKLHTEQQAHALQAELDKRSLSVQVAYGMRYGSPAIPDVLEQLRAQGCDRILILPAYP
ncbi:MAG: hypothetical protein EBY98_03545, partial [Acidimicrobiia bacterium]|nr:hypothetical protein [Acidimicrobiia bacterium]